MRPFGVSPRLVQLFVGGMLLPAALVAQPYVRPTTLIVPAELSSEVLGGLRALCGETKCGGTRWASRSFSEGLHPALTGVRVAGGASDRQFESTGALAAPARQLLRAQFLIGSDFGWSLDTLIARRDYSLSVEEARREVRRAVRGAGTFRPLTNTFLFVVSDSGTPTVKEENGNQQVSQTIRVAVFKIAFDSVAAAEAALADLYCEPGCPDRAAKASRFEAFDPPIRFVTGFDVSATGSAKETARAFRALADYVVETMIDETASAVPSFAVNAKLVSEAPHAARIGKKEGLYPGHRFYVYESRLGSDGALSERRTAVLYADRVADNRIATFGGTATRAEANVADSTTFRKVYPGASDRGTIIRERPSYLSLGLLVGSAIEEGFFSLEIRDEGFINRNSPIALPVGFKTLLALQVNSSGQEDYFTGEISSTTYVGLGLGYELYPMSGKFRVMPAIFGYKGFYDDGAEGTDTYLEEKGFLGLAFGLDVGFRLTPEIELTTAIRGFGRGENIGTDSDPELAYTYGPSFGVGLRLQRGLWGF